MSNKPMGRTTPDERQQDVDSAYRYNTGSPVGRRAADAGKANGRAGLCLRGSAQGGEDCEGE